MNDKELDTAIRVEKIITILKHATDGMVELASSALVTLSLWSEALSCVGGVYFIAQD